MQEKIKQIVSDIREQLEKISDSRELEALKVKVLGKKGQLTGAYAGHGRTFQGGAPRHGQAGERRAGYPGGNA